MLVSGLAVSASARTSTHEGCLGAEAPPPPVLEADLKKLSHALAELKDESGRVLWAATEKNQKVLEAIFRSMPRKTKLEQFFQLLYHLQTVVGESSLPVTVRPPGVTEVLLAARVFTNDSFPKQITRVELRRDDRNRPPLFRVDFKDHEVRFPINGGHGFETWDQGMCQIAQELVFEPGFSFRLRTARNSKNLVADDFDKVEIYGQFGTRKVFSIDLSYVDLEKVEFIAGTDEGRVKARVARREFTTNQHSALFKFIGTLIPTTSQQRIDW